MQTKTHPLRPLVPKRLLHIGAPVQQLPWHVVAPFLPPPHRDVVLPRKLLSGCTPAVRLGALVDVNHDGVIDEDGHDVPIRVTDLATVQDLLTSPDYAQNVGARLAERLRSAPPQHCAACHY